MCNKGGNGECRENGACKCNDYATKQSVTLVEPFDFGQAIKELKTGSRVARAGWNGKGMWLALMPSLYLDKALVNDRTKKFIGNETDLDCQPYIVMWTAAKQWQPGWLASQADILAEDWIVVK